MAQAPYAIPVRTTQVQLTGNYAGLVATMRLNPRRSVVDQLRSGEMRQCADAVAALVVDWNLHDERNQPLAIASEAIYDLPDDLLAALMTTYFEAFEEATTVPKSPDGQSGTS